MIDPSDLTEVLVIAIMLGLSIAIGAITVRLYLFLWRLLTPRTKK